MAISKLTEHYEWRRLIFQSALSQNDEEVIRNGLESLPGLTYGSGTTDFIDLVDEVLTCNDKNFSVESKITSTILFYRTFSKTTLYMAVFFLQLAIVCVL